MSRDDLHRRARQHRVPGGLRGAAVVFAALVGALALAGISANGVLGADAGPAPEAPSSSSQEVLPAGVHVVRELPKLRSADSDTYLLSNGEREAQVWPHPVNYRDAAGSWQPIDDELRQASDGSFQPVASPVPISLPAALSSGDVSVGSGVRRLSFSLLGAGAGEAATAGHERSYNGVMPGASVAYTATPQALRELLTLASASAPSSYTFSLSYGSALQAQLTGAGSVAFLDGAGQAVYTIPAPTLVDSSSAPARAESVAHYVLGDGGHTLTLVVSEDWLRQQERTFPVEIDPQVYFGAASDCTISSAQPDTSLCGQGLYVGAESEGGANLDRTLVRYELEEVPRDSVILSSDMQFGFVETTASCPLEVEAHALTRGFTDDATWESYDGTNPWSTPGGDFEAAFAGRQQLLPEWTGGWISFGISPLVERWVQEPSSNNGALLKVHDEATEGYDSFYQTDNDEAHQEPTIKIVYASRLGEQEEDMITGAELANGAEASVNVANGNLLLASPDVEYSGEGYETTLYRYYNSEDEDLDGSSFGPGWLLGEGGNTLLYPAWWDGSNVFRAPGGAYERFDPTPPATAEQNRYELTYDAPPGVEATLAVNKDQTRTLTFGETGVEWLFDKSENGFPQQIVEHEGVGNTISLEYESSELSHLEDSHGGALSISHDPSDTDDVAKIEGTDAKTWSYGYDEAGELATYEDPEGNVTSYAYGANGMLHVIEDESGDYVISYDDADRPRVTSVRRIVNGTIETPGSEDEAASFEYLAPQSPTCDPETDYGETIVRYQPEGEEATETYCYTASGEVTAWTGPEIEAEEPDPTESEPEEQETVPPGTCYENPEFTSEECGLEDLPAENEEEVAGLMQPLTTSIPDLSRADYGIADENSLNQFDIFTNPRFIALHVVNVRRTVPWNVVWEANHHYPVAEAEVKELKTWVEEAEALGKGTGQPTLSFEHCLKSSRWTNPLDPTESVSCEVVPDTKQYRAGIEEWLKTPPFSTVKYFTPWNEPNNVKRQSEKDKEAKRPLEPETGKPQGQQAGEYFRVLDGLCEKTKYDCKVGAGDFADDWMGDANDRRIRAGKYFDEYVKGMGHAQTAKFWAWHAYKEGEQTWTDYRGEPHKWWKQFYNFVAAVDKTTGKKPDIWLTEQGVVVDSFGKRTAATSKPLVQREIMRAYVEHSTDQLTRQSKQITRFFYYQMHGNRDQFGKRFTNFDSGLLHPSEKAAPRTIYRIYRGKTPNK